MDLPSIGSFKTGINVPDRKSQLAWKLMSLPHYMVSETGRMVDLDEL